MSAGTEPTIQAAPDSIPLSARLQSVLGIHPTGSDFLTPLAEILKAGGAENWQAATIEALVSALLRGGDPNALWPETIRQVQIDHSLRIPPDWKYSNPTARNNVVRYLWSMAESLHETDPDSATRYARAAVLLAAHDEFAGGINLFLRFGSDKAKMIKILQLNETQGLALGKIIDDLENGYRILYSDTAIEVLELNEKLVTGKSTLSDEQRQTFLGALRRWWISTDASRNTKAAFFIASTTWSAQHKGYAKNDIQTALALKDLLNEWHSNTPDGPIRNLLQQAIDRSEPLASPSTTRAK